MDNIIVGVDPGTTTAYSIFNLRTLEISTYSKRHMGINLLLRELVKHGHVLAIACDKKPCPKFVEKICSKLGSKLIVPEVELKEEEKRIMSNGFNCSNIHERDAIAAVVYSLKRLNPLLKKIDKIAEEKNTGQEFKDALTRLVFSGKSIKDAYQILKNVNFEKISKMENTYHKESREKIIEKGTVEKKANDKMIGALKTALKEKNILREQNKNLLKKISQLKRYNDFLMKKIISQEKGKSSKDGKEDNSENYFKELKQNFLLENENLKKRIENLNLEIEKLHKIILNFDSFVVLKKLKNFLSEEFETKNKILKIKEGDVLLVENPNEYSESTIKTLKEMVNFVFCKTDANKKIEEKLPFLFFNSKGILLEETEFFAAISKEDFEAEKRKKDFIKEIIKNYKLKKI
ncbi:MAG: DUF460 domain-containing protein [Candidatus Woesearchaeota archaeon]